MDDDENMKKISKRIGCFSFFNFSLCIVVSISFGKFKVMASYGVRFFKFRVFFFEAVQTMFKFDCGRNNFSQAWQEKKKRRVRTDLFILRL